MALAIHRLVVTLGLLALAAGCASEPVIPATFDIEKSAAEESQPLGGEALALRKREMNRAQRDMRHFHATLRGLDERKDRSGKILFSQFLDAYMGLHLEPLLAGEWQSNHPELMALDAGLRLAKADVLIWMHEQRRAQQTIDELKRRFQGRETMLVEYPIGGQTTLQQAIEMLKERKWRG
jgi:hypothetical protein